MRAVALFLGLAIAMGPSVAAAQFYGGIRTEPSRLPRTQTVESPGYEGAYDRSAQAWRDQRQECIEGKKRSSAAREACFETARTPPPLSSDYVKAPPAR
jgi:hypothetical protein